MGIRYRKLRQRAASAEFGPIPLTDNLRFWGRSDLGISLNAGNVAAWADQSGQGRHAIQTTAERQLPYIANATPSGRPAFRGTGTQFFERLLTFARMADGITAYTVLKYVATGYHNVYDNATQRPMVWIDNAARIEADTGTGYVSPGNYLDQWIVMNIRHGHNQNGTLRVNGAQVANGNPGALPLNITLDLLNRGGGLAFKGDLAALAIYDGFHTIAQAEIVESYLAEYAGIVI